MRIETETKLDFKDVLIRPKRSTLNSRSDVVLHKTFTLKHSKAEWSIVPLIASNMDTTGTFETAAIMAAHDTLTAIHKHYPVSTWEEALASEGLKDHKNKLFITSGIGSDDLKKLYTLTEGLGISNMCIDVANGYSEVVVDAIRRLRERYPSATIAAGNVVTGEMTEELILSGADIVKVGIGPGSVCTTRRVAGVGYPQLSAVIECADAAHGLGGLIISDGGCTCPGDVAKALGAGADFVMLGGMLAGHEESAGELIQNEKGERLKEFYGMSSAVAMQKYSGGVANYRACEGKRVLIPYRGQLNDTMQEILGGLRSACTYVGARYLKELSKRTTFVRVTQQLNPTFNTSSS